MAWGALWDLVREARLPARDYVNRALLAFPWEQDENLAGSLLGRALSALERYIPAEQTAPLAARWEELLLRRADDDGLTYALRKPSFDAFIGLAQTPAGVSALRAYLAETRAFNRKPIAQASRWAAVRRLIALKAPDADSLYRAEIARDTTPERLRAAFVASAAFPTAQNKARIYDRYFSDQALNEEWVTASLSAFNDPLHAELTLPYLKPALERATWIRDHRRIFFLPSWLQSFIESQNTQEALQVVDAFLTSTVRIRRR
jgi:aminopeptidase N